MNQEPKDVVTGVVLDHLKKTQGNVRAQLDILRKTRGMREVGDVQIPAHLRGQEIFDDSGIEVRGMPLPIRGVKG